RSVRAAARRRRHQVLHAGTARCAMTAIDTSTRPEEQSSAEARVAENYHPLPVTIASGEGVWVTDTEGKRYLDLLAAYSAVNFGHRHPALVEAATEQLGRITLTSRAFINDRLEPFAAALARLCGKELVLPMNTGAEAVETGIKVARAWGYRVKGIAPEKARIIVAARSEEHTSELQSR